MTMTPEQFDRLPRYAQQEIADLRRKLERIEDIHAEWLKPNEGDNTFWNYGLSELKPLGKAETVRFILGERYEDYIDCRIERGRLTVMGGNTIDIQPRSGNYVTVGRVAP